MSCPTGTKIYKENKPQKNMNTQILKEIGLTENEIKIYLDLLENGSSTAYEIGKRTNISRSHIYEKIELLTNKGLTSQIYESSKKYFQATSPEKIKQYIEDKRKKLDMQEKVIKKLLPELNQLIKTKKEVLISGIDEKKYFDALPIFMEQYFRDIRLNKIPEKVITIKDPKVFKFDKKITPTTKYRFLTEKQFNPTNTFIYGDKIVIVTWENPLTAIMIKNKEIAKTYKNHFEHLWKIASKTIK